MANRWTNTNSVKCREKANACDCRRPKSNACHILFNDIANPRHQRITRRQSTHFPFRYHRLMFRHDGQILVARITRDAICVPITYKTYTGDVARFYRSTITSSDSHMVTLDTDNSSNRTWKSIKHLFEWVYSVWQSWQRFAAAAAAVVLCLSHSTSTYTLCIYTTLVLERDFSVSIDVLSYFVGFEKIIL